MERHRRRAVVRICETERQRGGDRFCPVVSADRAEAARGRESKACGAVGLKQRWGIHGGLLRASREPPGSDRAKCQENAADRIRRQGLISNARNRPYREGAAAAGDSNGRGVDHGRGYKAAPGWRQVVILSRTRRSSSSGVRRSAGTVPTPAFVTAPALQRT